MQESILKLYAGQNILQNAAGNLQDFFFCRRFEKSIIPMQESILKLYAGQNIRIRISPPIHLEAILALSGKALAGIAMYCYTI